MAAFDFPSPPVADGTEVTNDATGVTYRYDSSIDCWVIISTEISVDVNDQISTLNSEILRIDGEIETALSERDELIQDAIDNNDAQNLRLDALESVDYATSAELRLETTARTLADGNLQSQIDDLETAVDNIDIEDIDLSGYYTSTEVDTLVGTKADTTYVDAGDSHLQDQVNELLITKGVASVYTLNDIGIIVGIRPGDFYIDNTVAKNVSFMTLAPVDDNGKERPLGAVGDILELVKSNNTAYRYEITTASDGVAGVQFQAAADPDDLLMPGTTFSVYIYPQNKASASIDYVDARHEDAKTYTDSVVDDYLPLAGGEMTGGLNMNGAAINTNALIKSTRTSGYAFQVYDQTNDTNTAFLHSNGNIRGAAGTFTSTLEVRDVATFKKNITCEANINVTGSVNNNGGWVKGNWGFETPGKGLRWYSADRNDHLADITFQTAKLENLMYDDYLWTLKVQNSGNTDSKTLIYGDYSSGLILNEVGEINTNGNVSIGGNLSFPNGGQINVSTGGTVLSGRASLEIKTAADYPVVFSSGSSYKKVLSIYSYDGTAPDNRGETAYINANGNAYFTSVFSNGTELSTRTYVDSKVADLFSIVEDEDAEPDIHYGDSAPAESGNGDLWVDTTQMRLLMRVNGAWVNPDREDSSVDLSEYKKVVSPPGRKFRKLDATNPNTDGTFTYYETNGQVKLGINRRDAEGTKWLDISFTDTLNAPVLFRIIQWQNNTSHRTVRYGAIDKIVATDGGQVVCDVKYHQTNGSLANGSNYFIIIGGLI